MANKIEINSELCKSCGYCVKACPRNLIKIGEKLNTKGFQYAVFCDEQGNCTACTFCAMNCPEIAIEVYKEES